MVGPWLGSCRGEVRDQGTHIQRSIPIALIMRGLTLRALKDGLLHVLHEGSFVPNHIRGELMDSDHGTRHIHGCGTRSIHEGVTTFREYGDAHGRSHQLRLPVRITPRESRGEQGRVVVTSGRSAPDPAELVNATDADDIWLPTGLTHILIIRVIAIIPSGATTMMP